MNNDNEIKMSDLCQAVSRDGESVQISIYRGDKNGWILEIEDVYGNSTVWDDEFKSDADALNEALDAINKEGISSFISPEPGNES